MSRLDEIKNSGNVLRPRDRSWLIGEVERLTAENERLNWRWRTRATPARVALEHDDTVAALTAENAEAKEILWRTETVPAPDTALVDMAKWVAAWVEKAHNDAVALTAENAALRDEIVERDAAFKRRNDLEARLEAAYAKIAENDAVGLSIKETPQESATEGN